MKNKFTIKNISLVITVEPSLGSGKLGLSEELDIRVEDGLIVEVSKDIPSSPNETIDATGKIVMPGFVDCHDHLWQSLIRGCGADYGLTGWLEECVFAVARAGLSSDDVFSAVKLSSIGLIETGVTTTLDWSHAFNDDFVDANLQALLDSGLRFGYGYYCQNNPSNFMKANEIKNKIDYDLFASMHICGHPAYEYVDELIDLVSVVEKLDLSLDIHLLESPDQIAQKPFEALQSAGAITNRLVADHVVHLTLDQIQSLGLASARITHNPLSNMRLGSGVAKLKEMNDAGIKIGLGLDGGTNDFPDFFSSMRAAVGLQRARAESVNIFPTIQDALWMGTLGGAEVLNLEEKVGSIKEGKFADLIILDPSWMNFGPNWNWINQIVLTGQPGIVSDVIVGGNFLKREGTLLGVNVEEVVQNVDESARKLKERMGLL